jgi:DNA-binding NtrC family response regulator
MSETAKSANGERPGPRQEDGVGIRALIVDDDEGLRRVLPIALGRAGMTGIAVEDGFAGLELLDRESFDVVLTDVQMPRMTGPQLLERIKTAGYPVEVIMMTAFADITTAVNAVKSGAYAFLTKPFVSHEAVLHEVRKAAQYKRLRETTEHLEAELSARTPGEGMLGSSPQMREVYRLISGVAATNSTVLVLGESGTGKELVARAIHERSRRARKRLVTVNCGAIPKDLVESELFGHVRGAFTSAVSARTGLFEAADGGTIFLDEIGDLPTSAQVKLLRTLQAGEVKPVGSDTTKIVDVRVVAATNADLRGAIVAGTFRQDLFYRLNVIAIRLPPLRERGDDLILLAQFFLQKHAGVVGRPGARLSYEAIQCLRTYDWPGNVRELEHAMEHAIVLSQDDSIPVSALPAEVRASSQGVSLAPPPVDEAPPRAGRTECTMRDLIGALGLEQMGYADAKKRLLTEFSEAYISELLQAANGNVSEAARRSKLDRSNFRRLYRPSSTETEPESDADGKPTNEGRPR